MKERVEEGDEGRVWGMDASQTALGMFLKIKN